MELSAPITRICEAVETAHARIQADFADINPIVAVNQQMRAAGIATDIMTIDCLRSGKRILMLFHDAQPETAHYQFCRRDADPADEFASIQLAAITEQQLYDWMRETFSTAA